MTGPDTHEVDVCIVGGGPAGLVLANLLAERGLKTLVLEKSPDFEREFRGEVLQPRFMRAMAQAGLADMIRAQPHEQFAQARFFYNGSVIGGFDFRKVDREFPYVTWMTQPIMLRALHARGETLPSYDLWIGARAHELLTDDERVVGVRVRREDAEVDVRARLVVGADGRFSSMVRLGGFETEYEHYRFDVLWFNIDRPPETENQISFYLSRDAAYLSLPKYPNLFQIGMMMTPGAFRDYRKRGIEAMREEIRSAHPWFASFADELQDFKQFHILQAKLSNRARWARDGLLLIGDAAHTCSPIGAIGVSIAVETAIVAADIIAGHPRDAPFTADVLGAVQARRAAAVRSVHRMQRLVGNNITSGSGLIKAMRPAMLRLASATGLLPRLAARMLTRKEPLEITGGE